MNYEEQQNPVYTPFFGVMGATFAMIFSGMSKLHFILCTLKYGIIVTNELEAMRKLRACLSYWYYFIEM